MLKELITNEDLQFVTGTLTTEPQGIVIHSRNGGGRSLLAKCIMRDVISNMGKFNKENECDRAVLIFDSETMFSEIVPQLIKDEMAPCYVGVVCPGHDSIASVSDFLGLLDHELSVTGKDYAVVYIDVASLDVHFKDADKFTETDFWIALRERLMDKGIWLILTKGLTNEYPVDKKNRGDVSQYIYDTLEKLEFANHGDGYFFPVVSATSYDTYTNPFGDLHTCSTSDTHYFPMKPLFADMKMLHE